MTNFCNGNNELFCFNDEEGSQLRRFDRYFFNDHLSYFYIILYQLHILGVPTSQRSCFFINFQYFLFIQGD